MKFALGLFQDESKTQSFIYIAIAKRLDNRTFVGNLLSLLPLQKSHEIGRSQTLSFSGHIFN